MDKSLVRPCGRTKVANWVIFHPRGQKITPSINSLSTFHQLLKRFLFRQSYPDVVYWQHVISGPCSGCATYTTLKIDWLIEPPHVAFAFLLTSNRPRAISSALLCLEQYSSLTILQSLALSVPVVQHWRRQPCIWPDMYGGAGGRWQPNYWTTGRLASRRPPNYRCPRLSVSIISTTRFNTFVLPVWFMMLLNN